MPWVVRTIVTSPDDGKDSDEQADKAITKGSSAKADQGRGSGADKEEIGMMSASPKELDVPPCRKSSVLFIAAATDTGLSG
jgi:hypothetical protein